MNTRKLAALAGRSEMRDRYCEGCGHPDEDFASIDDLGDENVCLRARVARLEELVQRLLDEDPNEQIADNGSTVLCAWRYDARRALVEK